MIENKKLELETLGRDIELLEKIKSPFPRISYTECIELLQKDGFKIQWGDDFGSPEETHISSRKSFCVHSTFLQQFHCPLSPL